MASGRAYPCNPQKPACVTVVDLVKQGNMKPVLAAHMTEIKSSKGSTNGPWAQSRHRHNTREHAEGGLGGYCRMAVLNDFEANGYGVTALDEHHVVVLNDVPATEKVSVSECKHCPAIQGCCSQV